MNISLPPGGMVIGLGTDIVDVERVRGAIDRHGARFIERVFTDEEAAYCSGKAAPHIHYAARFAAKEAVAKAFSTGIGESLDWKSIAVNKGSREEPCAVLDQKGKLLLEQVGGDGILLSLSHTATQALAVALIIKRKS